MEKKKLIIDTDCGSDDAWAIAMALNDPRYEIIMFTTVSGNVRASQATLNTLTTLDITDSYYPPVYQGCSEPLIRNWVGASETHGNDGLADLGYVPIHSKVAQGNGVLKMLDALRTSKDGEIDIIALGPLTNLALAIRLEPETFKKAGRVVVMGTAGLGVGNCSPVAEFNIWQDPEACKVVLEAGIKELIFVGWDACIDDAMFEEEEIDEIRKANKLGEFCIESNKTLMGLNVERFGHNCLDMADPAAMAAALEPNCIKTMEKYYCEVDCANGPSYGGVLVDFYHFSGKEENAYICSKLKVKEYKDYCFKTLKVR